MKKKRRRKNRHQKISFLIIKLIASIFKDHFIQNILLKMQKNISNSQTSFLNLDSKKPLKKEMKSMINFYTDILIVSRSKPKENNFKIKNNLILKIIKKLASCLIKIHLIKNLKKQKKYFSNKSRTLIILQKNTWLKHLIAIWTLSLSNKKKISKDLLI